MSPTVGKRVDGRGNPSHLVLLPHAVGFDPCRCGAVRPLLVRVFDRPGDDVLTAYRQVVVAGDDLKCHVVVGGLQLGRERLDMCRWCGAVVAPVDQCDRAENLRAIRSETVLGNDPTKRAAVRRRGVARPVCRDPRGRSAAAAARGYRGRPQPPHRLAHPPRCRCAGHGEAGQCAELTDLGASGSVVAIRGHGDEHRGSNRRRMRRREGPLRGFPRGVSDDDDPVVDERLVGGQVAGDVVACAWWRRGSSEAQQIWGDRRLRSTVASSRSQYLRTRPTRALAAPAVRHISSGSRAPAHTGRQRHGPSGGVSGAGERSAHDSRLSTGDGRAPHAAPATAPSSARWWPSLRSGRAHGGHRACGAQPWPTSPQAGPHRAARQPGGRRTCGLGWRVRRGARPRRRGPGRGGR